MKKLDHSERLEKANKQIAKTHKRHDKKFTPKQKKITSITLASTAIVGIVAAATTGLVLSATADKRASYPDLPGRFYAEDFKSPLANKNGNYEPQNIITNGSQGSANVTIGKKGPVKFLSNYPTMYNNEKMSDFLNWFYHDVSWGPEIATLTSVNLLSGIQRDGNMTILGYHTTSRDGSTIIMSPDYFVNQNYLKHRDQSFAYAISQNATLRSLFAPEIGEDGNLHPLTYRKIVDWDGFTLQASRFFDMPSMMASTLVEGPKALPPAPGAPAPAPAAPGVVVASATMPGTYSFYTGKDINLTFDDKISFTINNWSKANIVDKYKMLKSFNMDTRTFQLAAKAGKDLVAELGTIPLSDIQVPIYLDEAKLDKMLEIIKMPLFKSLATTKMYVPHFPEPKKIDAIINNEYSYTDYNKILTANTYLNKILAEVYNRTSTGRSDDYFHMSTQSQIASFFKSGKLLRQVLRDWSSITNTRQYANKDEKIASALSVVFAYLKYSPISGYLPGKKTPAGDAILYSAYKKLWQMTSDEIDNSLDNDFVYDLITKQNGFIFIKPSLHDTYSNVNYTKDEINQLLGLIDENNTSLLGLSKHLQDKYKPGFDANGKWNHGIPVYKENDTFYDSIIRRASQEMMYTISHEYGHHTTMFHAQDVSTYKDITSVGKNAEAVGSTYPAVVPSAEVLTSPNFGSYFSGDKYNMFKNAFTSKYYKDIIDRSSDGDSRTDVTTTRYQDIYEVDVKGEQYNIDIRANEEGVDGILVHATNHVFNPLYIGDTEVAFGNKEATGMLQDLVDGVQPQNEVDDIQGTDLPKQPTDRWPAFKNTLLAGFVSNHLTNANVADVLMNQAFSAGLFIDNYDLPQPTPDGNGFTAPYSSIGIMDKQRNYFISRGELTAEETNFAAEVHNKIHDEIARVAKAQLSIDINQPAFFQDRAKMIQVGQLAKRLNLHKVILDKYSFKDQYRIFTYIMKASSGLTLNNFPIFTPYGQGLYKMYNVGLAKGIFGPGKTITNFDQFIKVYIPSQYNYDSTNGWTVKPTASSINWFVDGTYNKYLEAVIEDAKQISADYHLPATHHLTGELLTRAFLERAGKSTKKVFEGLIDPNFNNIFTCDRKDENVSSYNDITKKFNAYHIMFAALKKASSETANVTEMLDYIKDTTKTYEFEGKTYTLKLNSDYVDNILKPIFEDATAKGAVIFEMKTNQNSPAAVIYVFNKDEDTKKYQTVFSTAAVGMNPPASFIRYSSSYVEQLTRVWNQVGFNVPYELTLDGGEYYKNDQIRLLAYGEKLYETTINHNLTAEGQKVIEMYKKYYNTDKDISAIVRNWGSGLYTFFGYSDKDHEHKQLVFTQNNGTKIIGKADLVYNVDNLHYYEKHGDITSEKRLTDRHSWMAKYMVLGDFQNSVLTPGDYEVNFWDDDNNDGIMQASELKAVKNNQIQNDGMMNANGKTDETSEVEGNPEDLAATERFKIRVHEILI